MVCLTFRSQLKIFVVNTDVGDKCLSRDYIAERLKLDGNESSKNLNILSFFREILEIFFVFFEINFKLSRSTDKNIFHRRYHDILLVANGNL